MSQLRILGLRIDKPADRAMALQQVFGKFGCSIRTRLGLHTPDEDVVDRRGVILLELAGDLDEMDKLEVQLSSLEGVEVRKMIFE
jgi:hypothetical protein